ncbi:MAG TPA: hypothetical protein PLU50_07935, partial [Pseudobdellovibrionaceae bacterium]|nr:hypothetical protein [Pseudobdellovibrionaceae bacterium]
LLSLNRVAFADSDSKNHFCELQAVQNPLVQSRSFQIQFQDGRRIIVVGHHHGRRGAIELVNEYNIGQLQKTSDEDLLNRITEQYKESIQPKQLEMGIEFLTSRKQNAELESNINFDQMIRADRGFSTNIYSQAEHAFQDYIYTKSLLNENQPADDIKKIRFIGVESGSLTWEFYLGGFANVLAYFQKRDSSFNYSASTGQPPSAKNLFLMTSFMGHVFAALTQNMGNLLVPAENSQLLLNEKEFFQKFVDQEQKLNEVNQSYIESREPLAQALILNSKMYRRFEAYISMTIPLAMIQPDIYIDAKAYVRNLVEISPFWLKDEMLKYETLFLAVMSHIQARDVAVAKNLANRKESGAHFTGLAHVRGVAHQLRALCLQESNIRP